MHASVACDLSQVKPYHFDFLCNVRGQWRGHTLLEVYCRVWRIVPPQLTDHLSEMHSLINPRPVGRLKATDLLQEFPERDRAYYEQALIDGRLRVEGRVDGRPIEADTSMSR